MNDNSSGDGVTAAGLDLERLAGLLGEPFRGDPRTRVVRVADLLNAEADCLSFLGDRKYRGALAHTRAGVVILSEPDAAAATAPVVISRNPYLSFARAARLLYPSPAVVGGIHPAAVVAPDAVIDPSAWIGPTAVVEAGAQIGPRVFVGPGSIVGEGVSIGEDSRLVARVTLCRGTRVGKRALLHPGAVIGRSGFGFAKDGERWVRIPQVGRAVLGDDVEIGANTTVDRGAIGDTVIHDGVKLDNHIQIGHNVEVGEHTAMAAMTGISGSTRIGRNCTIAGAVGMAGHLTIGDQVHFTGQAMVTRSFAAAGSYSSGIPAMPSAEWRRNVARFRQLDELTRRLKQLEARVAQSSAAPGQEDN
ncbi:UDP-3-O-(3-hydroxymyristoyl)glucosamine N-acyltransferase [uncultured Thiodictyon sp.]|uniref:UDP-3-O-(3-hydroxymyristoyl)glucosamine N-acyltransferase n=1 Tax=uncultured Thiodictyon sp. TaxID=1846217 RepID=UPI0025EAA8EF|nr:UDP-3-O-(3-hydroxymyristoyl)glucosamine N-acyltransferase [uncultured Thiodictyon sp.]